MRKFLGFLVKLGFLFVALGGLFVLGLIAYAYIMDKLEEDDDEDFDFDDDFDDEDDFEDEDEEMIENNEENNDEQEHHEG